MISETPLHALVAQAERDAKAHLDEAQRANLHGNDNTERMHRTLAQVHQWFADQIKAALLLTAGPQETEPKMMIRTIPHLCPHCHKPTGGTAITTMASGACGTPFETEVLL